MDARRLMGWGLVALCAACSGAKQAVRAPSEQATGGSGPVAMQQSQASVGVPESRRYVDETLGFELTQPGGDWLLDETEKLRKAGQGKIVSRPGPGDSVGGA